MTRKILWLWLSLLTLGSLTSCSDYAVDLGGGYILRAIDGKENMAVAYGDKSFSVAIVDQTVFEVLWNDDFILARRHPSKLGVEVATIKRDSIEYYIVEKIANEKDNPHRKVKGPLNLAEYEVELRQLGLNESRLQKTFFEEL